MNLINYFVRVKYLYLMTRIFLVHEKFLKELYLKVLLRKKVGSS